MFSLALPMCLLYGVAVGLCVLHDRRADRRALLAGDDDAPSPA